MKKFLVLIFLMELFYIQSAMAVLTNEAPAKHKPQTYQTIKKNTTTSYPKKQVDYDSPMFQQETIGTNKQLECDTLPISNMQEYIAYLECKIKNNYNRKPEYTHQVVEEFSLLPDGRLNGIVKLNIGSPSLSENHAAANAIESNHFKALPNRREVSFFKAIFPECKVVQTSSPF